jgi:hypothetical protein
MTVVTLSRQKIGRQLGSTGLGQPYRGRLACSEGGGGEGRFGDDSRQRREEGKHGEHNSFTVNEKEGSFELSHSWVAPPQDCCWD